MKQMFAISEKLTVGQSDEIYGVNTINWSDSSWKHLSLIDDEEVISLSHAKVYVFSDSVLCLGKMRESTITYCLGRQIDVVQKFHLSTELWTQLMVSQWNSTLQFCYKVQEFMSKLSIQPEDFTGRIIFMSMFNDISE